MGMGVRGSSSIRVGTERLQELQMQLPWCDHPCSMWYHSEGVQDLTLALYT